MVLSLDISDEPIHSSFILIDHGNEMMEIPSGSSEADIVSVILQFGFVKATDLAGALNLAISWNGATRTVMIG